MSRCHSTLHAATRRELLLASGTLFAWAYLPKMARAEGRDPRLLVIVLRGALDGLAAVAPVGDPDWLALRGTDGTDHGTATVALLAGGALRGGRVVADWPGLKPAKLHDGRDLKPTTDLRAVLKGLLKDHLRVDAAVLATNVFPDSAAVKPMAGLLQQA